MKRYNYALNLVSIFYNFYLMEKRKFLPVLVYFQKSQCSNLLVSQQVIHGRIQILFMLSRISAYASRHFSKARYAAVPWHHVHTRGNLHPHVYSGWSGAYVYIYTYICTYTHMHISCVVAVKQNTTEQRTERNGTEQSGTE